ncbi:MAG: hypothetical protein ACREBU_01445 [Nitrososphaera sp.]
MHTKLKPFYSNSSRTDEGRGYYVYGDVYEQDLLGMILLSAVDHRWRSSADPPAASGYPTRTEAVSKLVDAVKLERATRRADELLALEDSRVTDSWWEVG